MNTLRALIALPFVLLGLALRVLLLPSLLLFIVWMIWGTNSSVFGFAVLAWCGWVWLEYRTLRGVANYRGRGRKLY